jgi:hypothetical protein
MKEQMGIFQEIEQDPEEQVMTFPSAPLFSISVPVFGQLLFFISSTCSLMMKLKH